MGYVIAGILVLLIVAAFVTFLVMNSMRKGAGGGTSDPSARQSDRGGPPGIGQDPTPLGDTDQHAGAQTEHGTTAEDPERNAGEDTAADGYDPARTEGDGTGAQGDGPGRPARPEDRQRRDAGASGTPESERLADRPG
jgi:hypothetical protein